MRAFTPDDEKALRAAARTFPKTKFYDVEETLTTLGIGEGLVTVLAPNGAPTPPFISRMVPPSSRMGPLTDAEMNQRLASSAQVQEYSKAVDRQSAREMLEARHAPAAQPVEQSSDEAEGDAHVPVAEAPRGGGRAPKAAPSTFEQIMKSPVTRTVAGVVARGIMGALLGGTRRRRY